ncbi:MAG TPA: hypothetical protein DCE44_15825, partial [Verrucomicrobiales bacterium]|nr:hypothetical protein [Verrucomicrobiales bacterium]
MRTQPCHLSSRLPSYNKLVCLPQHLGLTVSIGLIGVAQLHAQLAQQAQPASEARAEVVPVVLERGADYRVVEWVQAATDEAGDPITATNQFTMVASGLHYLDSEGQWRETVSEFVPVENGFVAARGPHQVALSSDIATPGAVTVVTAEGQTLTSNPTLLAYVDRATGQSVHLAALKSSRGEQVEAGTILYADAFDLVSASVRAVYRASGFECDVILHRQLPDPAQFGLNPETTDLAVYSEFFGTQPSAAVAREVPVGTEEKAVDT